MKRSLPVLVITPGDPEGIGPEIVWKTLRARAYGKCMPFCVGAREPFDRLRAPVTEIAASDIEAAAREFRPKAKPRVLLLPAPTSAPGFLPGYQSGWAVAEAVKLVLAGRAKALVTGPISKERLQRGGFPYSGHTDFLADLCKTPEVTMMLANDRLRISLVTVHIALRDVPGRVSRKGIRRAVLHTVDYLKGIGIGKPRIAVAALNPHAGEGGLFGNEDDQVVAPEVRALQEQAGRGFELLGPLPSDTLFAKHIAAKRKDRFDAVVCMYHDQGLIPVKLLDFPNTVNITLGLPIIRTSVDHGTGFDIAGTGKADPSSLQSAIRVALKSLV